MTVARRQHICLTETCYYHCMSVVFAVPFYAASMPCPGKTTSTVENGWNVSFWRNPGRFVLMWRVTPSCPITIM